MTLVLKIIFSGFSGSQCNQWLIQLVSEIQLRFSGQTAQAGSGCSAGLWLRWIQTLWTRPNKNMQITTKVPE